MSDYAKGGYIKREDDGTDSVPEETRGGEEPGDWKCGTATEQAAQMWQYIKDNYGEQDKAE